jgi:hypothetical protein
VDLTQRRREKTLRLGCVERNLFLGANQLVGVAADKICLDKTATSPARTLDSCAELAPPSDIVVRSAIAQATAIAVARASDEG